MDQQLKRYAVTIEYYVYAKSDEDAIKKTNKRCQKQITKYDDQCWVVNLVEVPYGSLTPRIVQLNK